MEDKKCFALKSSLGILKFLVSDKFYVNKLKPFQTTEKVREVRKGKNFQLVCGKKKSPLLENSLKSTKGELESTNGYFLISPIGTGLSYFIDGAFDPVFRKEIIIDERSLAEAISTSPESVRKYVPASKIKTIKNDATLALFNRTSANPNISANLDIIDEFLANDTSKESLVADTENA